MRPFFRAANIIQKIGLYHIALQAGCWQLLDLIWHLPGFFQKLFFLINWLRRIYATDANWIVAHSNWIAAQSLSNSYINTA